MGVLGLHGVRRTKSPRTTRSAPKDQCPADLVKRHFNAFRPNELWVADVPPQAGGAPAYVRTFSGWAYVAFITDVYSRRIIGWQTTYRPVCTDLALDALRMAVWQRKRQGADLSGLVDGRTAVISNNPAALVGLACAVQAHGLSIPADLSVLTLGVTEYRGRQGEAFSELSVDREAMGAAAGSLLLTRLRGEPAPVKHRTLMSAVLTDHGSTARCRD